MKVLPEGFPFEAPLKYRKEDWETDPRFGQFPEERSLQKLLKFGVINLDKPPNVNSHQLTAYLKEVLGGVEKIGHGGTLDPGVSGILPIALERATPLGRVYLKNDKEYVGVMRLHEEVAKERLGSVLEEFEGEIYQRPPKASSVKRRVRKRRNYEITLLEMKERNVLLRVKCEAGTYIRKLFYDIGEVLGSGAHMVDLRRTRSGSFEEDETLQTVQDVVDAWMFYKNEGQEKHLRDVILPPEASLLEMPRVILEDGAIEAITHGAPIYLPGIIGISPNVEKDTLVASLTVKGELVALVNALMNAEEAIKKEKGQFSGKMRVLMQQGVYPRSWE